MILTSKTDHQELSNNSNNTIINQNNKRKPKVRAQRREVFLINNQLKNRNLKRKVEIKNTNNKSNTEMKRSENSQKVKPKVLKEKSKMKVNKNNKSLERDSHPKEDGEKVKKATEVVEEEEAVEAEAEAPATTTRIRRMKMMRASKLLE